ncbi:MAG: V-type ATPase subunit [Lachnospiraceae bacterium]|jgi:V/A-type H+-transporting ATPase subunit C|nr:V-type ATPase subunit [Lachnospiraceae bacterium]MCH4108439.1 V-type ATPase subunit [Lachnospiraceae bacterium]MCI1302546.1 V-type ATPase subunit [Lachnospiraceae bacterium]MCI1331719.1 V-type ATPase subunit [Lachnospiraceae bacterium]MCI1360977.1 V-type ATPase subunit [Lachnospiraceae bacterium]
MADTKYIYAVARVRTHEKDLLDAGFMDQLAAAKDESSALKMLHEHGWGSEGMKAEEIFSQKEDETWAFMRELLGDISVFNVFFYKNDFHNLKAAIKESCIAGTHPGIFAARGTLDPKWIQEKIENRRFADLPESMSEVAKQATDTLLSTRDGQLCDILVDAGALRAIKKAGQASGNEILKQYGELTVASSDIKVAVRASRMGKSLDFMKMALVPCDTLDVKELGEAAARGEDAVYDCINRTPYHADVDILKKSMARFERRCDDRLIEAIRPQRHNSFGLGPLAAYVLATETEIRSVRIILSGKRNHFPEEYIRERIRLTYA